jgi:ribosomal protein S18 acetylase RimI-like enzyme
MSYLAYLWDKVRYNPPLRIFIDGLDKLGIQIKLFYLIQEGISVSAARQQWDKLRGYEVVFLGVEDMSEIARFPYRPISYEELQSRLKDGKLCLGAKRDGQLAAFTWCSLTWCDFEGCRFPLKDDEAYLFDVYTASHLRGQGLAPALRYCLYEELARMGRTKLYSITDRFNRAALRFKLKLGAQVLKSGWHVTFIKKYDFGPRYKRP